MLIRPRLASLAGFCFLAGAGFLPCRPLLAIQFIRGDANQDGFLDISDPVKVIFHLLLGQSLGCLDGADANDSGDLNITDAVYLLLYQFVDGLPPPAPFPNCGVDPLEDSLGCDQFSPCAVVHETFISREGGTIILPFGVNEKALITIPAGFLSWPAGIAAEARLRPAPLLSDDPVPDLPVLRLEWDGLRADSSAPDNVVLARLPAALVQAVAATSPGHSPPPEATVFISTTGRRFFYTLPLEAIEDPSDDTPGDLLLRLPSSLFKRAREWGLVGRGGLIDTTRVVIQEITLDGKARLDIGGTSGLGLLRFAEEGRKTVIEVEVQGAPRTLEVASPESRLSLEIVAGWTRLLLERGNASLSASIGGGRLYRVVFPELQLVEVTKPDLESAAWVLVHGWDLADPFRDMFDFTFTGLALRPAAFPKSADEVKDRLKKEWQAALDYFNRPGAGGVYLYAYNPYLGIKENAAALAARLREAFDWRNRRLPLAFLGRSTGGLLGACAMDSEFGLDQQVPSPLRLVSLGTPFRGIPIANRSFQGYWSAGGFKPLVDAARSQWQAMDSDARRFFPLELLGSLIGAWTFFTTDYPGARDADLDALWAGLGKAGLENALFPVGAESSGSGQPRQFQLSRELMAGYQDPFLRLPYARSDGLTPLASALRRQGLSDAFWFSVDESPPAGKEHLLAGENQRSLGESLELFKDLGLGSGELANSLGMRFLYVPPGSFLMGSAAESRGHRPDEKLHRVHVKRGFYLGVFEVTQAQFEALMGANPSAFTGDPDSPNRPVEQVSWDDAVKFCQRLTLRERTKTAIRPDELFRLPTEAEWEYACRADTSSRFSFGDVLECGDASGACAAAAAFLWWRENSSLETQAVGGKGNNPWNLCDMHGNVLEWCLDWYGPYPDGEAADPAGPSTGTTRVLRGGDWRSQLQLCRSAYRGSSLPVNRGSNFGFRVLLTVEIVNP